MDGRGIVASALTIKNARIVNVGQAMPLGPGAKTIDLGGRTVIPGLLDAHVHYTRAGINPGYEARRIERALSIAELQEAIALRAKSVPPGEFIRRGITSPESGCGWLGRYEAAVSRACKEIQAEDQTLITNREKPGQGPIRFT